MSSWNFDVAALKAQADLEGDDEPMLPMISEADESEDMTLTGISMTAAVDFLAASSCHTTPRDAPTYISAFGEDACLMQSDQ